MRPRSVSCALLAAAAVLVAGCSSGSLPAPSPLPASVRPTTASVSPSPSSVAPTSSAARLSPYEADPAVIATRRWMAQAARTVNSGKFDDAALNALMTPTLAATMKNVLGSDVGRYYPGPIPFLPLAVASSSPTTRGMRLCVVGTGFARNAKTQKAAAPLKVVPIDAAAELGGGVWRVNQLNNSSAFSCATVRVPMPTW